MKHYDKSNWKKVRLGDVSAMFSGGTPSVDNKSFYNNGNIPFIRSGEIAETKTELYITEEALNNSSAKLVQRGDLLLALYGATSGKVAISNIKGAINQAILCIRSQMFLPAFLYHFLTYNQTYIISTFLQGGQGNLSAEIIKGLYVDVPPASEQSKISNILSQIDSHIENIERIISKQESIKKTTVKLLLEPKSDYNTVTLGDIVVLAKGEQLGKSQMDPSGEYMVMNGGITASGKTNKYNHLGNTITISEGGNSCGFVSFIKDNFWCGGHCYTLENLKADTDYLYQLLKYREDSIMKLRVGSGLPNIPKNRLASLILAVINSKEHQKRIAAQLSEIDAHIENLKQQLAKQRAIKQGLMDYFFGN